METIEQSQPVAKRDANGAYIRSGLEHVSGSFSDPRVFLTMPWDPNVAVVYADPFRTAGVCQASDGPAYLVVGPFAPDEGLESLSDRYGVPIADIIEFRDSLDVTLLPIWIPLIQIQSSESGIRFEHLGKPMPKQNAWDIAKAAMESRDDVICMAVRRQSDARFNISKEAGNEH